MCSGSLRLIGLDLAQSLERDKKNSSLHMFGPCPLLEAAKSSLLIQPSFRILHRSTAPLIFCMSLTQVLQKTAVLVRRCMFSNNWEVIYQQLLLAPSSSNVASRFTSYTCKRAMPILGILIQIDSIWSQRCFSLNLKESLFTSIHLPSFAIFTIFYHLLPWKLKLVSISTARCSDSEPNVRHQRSTYLLSSGVYSVDIFGLWRWGVGHKVWSESQWIREGQVCESTSSA